MKRAAILAAIAFYFALPTCLKAQDTPPSAPVALNPLPSSMRQDHFEAGVFANYLSSNFADGLGFPTPRARLALQAWAGARPSTSAPSWLSRRR